MSKNDTKHEIPLELILYGLKWKSVFLEKLQGFDVKMHQNRQNSVKTSELEDQYAIIFSLALWAEEPPEIIFFKKSWFSQKVFVQKCQTFSNLGRNGSRIEMMGSDLVYMDRE